MGAHRYSVCVHVYMMCMCVSCYIVVTVLGEHVPGPTLQAPCTKNLSVLPGGIWLSVWAAPKSAGPCAQPPALSTQTDTHSEHTWQSHMHLTSLASTGLWHTLTSTNKHAHHQHPGKADLLLSWITDIHTASCSPNNLISLTPSLWVYNEAYNCVRCLSDSVWLICGLNPQQVFSAHSSTK